ncbi:MAG TPA: DNA cytosine methyltransferase, partial [Chitinophagales bacterium]
MSEYLTLAETAEMLSKNKETLRRWDREGKLTAVREPMSNYRVYKKAEVETFFGEFILTNDDGVDDENSNFVVPKHDYKVLELFAGAGGLAVGMEQAGLKCIALNEIDKFACETLRKNRPNWEVLEGDIKNFDFSAYKNTVDVVT